jgi:hypothetical protein
MSDKTLALIAFAALGVQIAAASYLLNRYAK